VSDLCGPNKENIDTTNKHVFRELIKHKVTEHTDRKKSEHLKGEFFRILLTQAQTIESSLEAGSLAHSNTGFEVDGSLLSSISKQAEHCAE
jgi:hypothetical protein